VCDWLGQTAVSGPGYSVKTIVDPRTCVGMHNHYCWGFVESAARQHHDVDPAVGLLQHYKRCHFDRRQCRRMMNDTRRDDTIAKYRRTLTAAVSRKLAAFYRWDTTASMPTTSRPPRRTTPYPPRRSASGV